jgi:hypothetical protein
MNEVIVQGRVGPPTIGLTPEGQLFASAGLQIEDTPDATITVIGTDINAPVIADGEAGDTLRIVGRLGFDTERHRVFVVALTAQRMTEQHGTLVPLPPSMKVVHRFEKLFLEESAQA